jgi:hypothetical protein
MTRKSTRSDAEEERSFLKKRTKKPLFPGHRLPASRAPTVKSFLLLFFKKEVFLSLLVVGCTTPHPKGPGVTPKTQGRIVHGPMVADDHVPPFALVPWEPFAREDAIAIAMREWRLFGQTVDDDPPGTRPHPPPELKPEREPGLWQRVGEYWWVGQDPGEREVSWTGKHDEAGVVFPAEDDGTYAWSAAFISYVMRIAGAGADFPYSPNHSTYINAAVLGTTKVLRAYPPQAYAPMAGDLMCLARGKSAGLSFADLPTVDPFPAHCDLVVQVTPGVLTVVGGNVDDAVTMKHVPVSPAGLLTGSDGKVLDTRYGWMVVLKVNYEK